MRTSVHLGSNRYIDMSEAALDICRYAIKFALNQEG